MKKSPAAAFTLVELLVAAAVSVALAGIIYTMGSEALFSFSRNVSLNRAYSEARSSLDRIGMMVQSSAHPPCLINEDGSVWSSSTLNTSEAAGMRFFCYNTQPSLDITTCLTTSSTMQVTVPAGATAPKVGDLITITAVGFQGIVASATAGNGGSKTLTFTDMYGVAATTISKLCSANSSATTDLSPYNCLLANRVAFIAVSTPALPNPAAAPSASNAVPATSTELRYYSDSNVMTKYKVIAHLVLNQTDTQEALIQRPRPFQIADYPTVTVTLCEQAPDYTNRTSVISNATTFARLQSAFGARSPALQLTGPW